MKILSIFSSSIIFFLALSSCKQAEQTPKNETVVKSTGELVGLEIGQIAPDFTQNDQYGKPISLKDFRGKVVMIDFWATWCGPCIASIPHVKEIKKKYASSDLIILGVSLDNADSHKKFIKAEKLNFPL